MTDITEAPTTDTQPEPKPRKGKRQPTSKRKTPAARKAALRERINGLDKVIVKLQKEHDDLMENTRLETRDTVEAATEEFLDYGDVSFAAEELRLTAVWLEKRAAKLLKVHDRIQQLIERVNVAEEQLGNL